MTNLRIDYWVRRAIVEEKLDIVRRFIRIEGGTYNRDRMHTHYSRANRFLVAEQGHKLIAALSYSTAGFQGAQVPTLVSAMVLRPYRRNGIGTRLCVQAIAELVDEGCTPIHCTTASQESYEFVLSLPQASLRHLRVHCNSSAPCHRLPVRYETMVGGNSIIPARLSNDPSIVGNLR